MISDYDKAHVADILRGEGDWFTAKLLRALDVLLPVADSHNRARLVGAFPEECQVILDYYNTEV